MNQMILPNLNNPQMALFAQWLIEQPRHVRRRSRRQVNPRRMRVSWFHFHEKMNRDKVKREWRRVCKRIGHVEPPMQNCWRSTRDGGETWS